MGLPQRGTQLNVFDFTVSRHRDGPDDFLVNSGFAGTTIADCYSGYQGISLRSDERIVRAACHAHASQRFDACVRIIRSSR